MRLKRIPLLVTFTALLLTSMPAAAVTVEQIVALSKAGVSEAVILALLDRDRTVLTIDPDQLVTLKREGLSDALIVAMLKNGRDEAEAAANAVSEEKAASVLATLPLSASLPAPDLVIVGHGPERPNTGYSSTGFRTSWPKGVYPPALPYGTGRAYKRGFDGYRGDGYRNEGYYGDRYRGDRMLCVAQVNTPRGPGPSYITECPAVMQPSLKVR